MLQNELKGSEKIMAGIPKNTREDIVLGALELVKEKGFEALKARDIAKRLNCSIQPIFYQFKSMEDLKVAVCEKIYKIYCEYMLSGENTDTPYKAMGNSYVRFARDYPELFKILFMQKAEVNSSNFMQIDYLADKVISEGQKFTGLSFDEQKDFQLKVWIFTHGIASLTVTETLKLNDEEIDKIISDSIRQMSKGYKIEKGDR